jgi:hypothetical protein
MGKYGVAVTCIDIAHSGFTSQLINPEPRKLQSFKQATRIPGKPSPYGETFSLASW